MANTIFNDIFGVPNKGGGGRGAIVNANSNPTQFTQRAPQNPGFMAGKTAGPKEVKAPDVQPAAAPPPVINTQNTPDFSSSVMSMIDAAVKPNPLNAYYQTTYHFRLFMAPDIADQLKTSVADVVTLRNELNKYPQVTIAESGVTGFNIKDVQIQTKLAGNATTRNDTGTLIDMTVTEPNGISFLDGVASAAKLLSIANYTKATYYLELRFLGYDENGKAYNALGNVFDNGGVWMWAMTPRIFKVKASEGGCVYSLGFNASNETYLTDKDDIIRSPSSITAVGNTLDSFYADFINKLNDAWIKAQGAEIYSFQKVVTRSVGEVFPNPPGASMKNPGLFNMKSINGDTQPDWHFKNKVFSATLAAGSPINEFLIDAIKHTEEGQALAKDNNNVRGQMDKSATEVNDRGHRETILWSVEPVITLAGFHTASGQYTKHVTFHIMPHYAQPNPQTATELAQARTADVQQSRIKSLIDNGMLQKRYDYIFTGKNTEVFDFDLGFDLQWNSQVASYSGAVLRYDNTHVNARTVNGQPLNVDSNSDQTPPTPTQPLKSFDTTAAQQNLPAGVLANATSTDRVASGPAIAEVSLPSANVYVEDAMKATQLSGDFVVPISFWQNKNTNSSGVGAMTGQTTPDQPLAGALWAHHYDDGVQSKAYQNIKMTIRGDPYWLGQTNLHRQVNLSQSKVSVPKNPLPDFSTNHTDFFVYFRYPQTIGNDFQPVLTSSLVFNGVYKATQINHTFSDGVFKQEFENCPREDMIDPTLWTGGSNAAVPPAAKTPDPVNQTPAPVAPTATTSPPHWAAPPTAPATSANSDNPTSYDYIVPGL